MAEIGTYNVCERIVLVEMSPISNRRLVVVLRPIFRTKIYTDFQIRGYTEADGGLKIIEGYRAASVEIEPRNVAVET